VVVVTASFLPAVIPPTPTGTPSQPAGSRRRPPPLAVLEPDPVPVTDTVYAVSAVDKSGRVADRSIVRALGRAPGTRLDFREQSGIIAMRAAAEGVHRIDDHGHLHLPLPVRRWCRLAAGDRILFAADRATGVLAAYPVAVLDRLLAGAETCLTRGEEP
jgi:bifunctional DNA-binding transcriptional regulator/antitoxin component of YhaV-PrlF toxin-antitoxin module